MTESSAPDHSAQQRLDGAAQAQQRRYLHEANFTAERQDQDGADSAIRDIAEVAAAEVITTVAVHLMSASAVKVGLADKPEEQLDLAEARILITALAGLVVSVAPDLDDTHARSLRDGLRSLQLAFREASPFPDAPGLGPGEKHTGPVN